MNLPRRLAIPVLLALAAGCDCQSGSLGGTAVGFTVSGDTVDFGRVLQGTQESRPVTLVSAGRVDLDVDVVSSGSPFSAPATVTVPAGGRVNVDVVFTAGATVADGKLTLSARGKSVSVPLQGEGVVPLPCMATGPCRVSTFDLSSNTCIETVAPDGTPCVSGDLCLDHTACLAGVCQGAARNCEDGDACTTDDCSQTLGCVHTMVTCPGTNEPCHQAVCDHDAGCGIGPVGDGSPCGAVDCIHVNLCFSGNCLTLPTPDGFLCAPPTPCQDAGECHAQHCVRPDAGDLGLGFSLSIGGQPPVLPPEAPTLLGFQGNVFWSWCGDDGGACGLDSFTFNGFPRFFQTYPDARPRWLAAVTDAGALVEAGDALELYDGELGVPLWAFPSSALTPPPEVPGFVARTAPGRTTALGDGTVTAVFTWWPSPPDAGLPDGGADGGVDAGTPDAGPWPALETWVRLFPDGGLDWIQVVRGQGTGSRLATTASGTLVGYDPLGPLVAAQAVDGGVQLGAVAKLAGLSSEALSGGYVFAGADWLVGLDGGVTAGPLVLPMAPGPSYPDPRVVLAAFGFGYQVLRACMPPLVDPCAPSDQTAFLQSYDVAFGTTAWTSQAAPTTVLTRFEEGALLSAASGEVLLSETAFATGPESYLQLFDDQGRRLFACRVPPPGALGGATYEGGNLYLLIQRPGAWSLEAYGLKELPFETTGWPVRNGLSGTRQER